MRIYRGILSHGAFLQAANPTLLVGKNNGRKHWNNGSGQYFSPQIMGPYYIQPAMHNSQVHSNKYPFRITTSMQI